ncbi:MAG: transglycosylase SLT domain-containing protein [Polyangiaceae bacterium]|nr:transglycosylase SLT domain-containing protein [Polyangiaceae bacterium]
MRTSMPSRGPEFAAPAGSRIESAPQSESGGRFGVGRVVRGVAAGVLLGTVLFFAISKDARHRLDAAARVFRDPALLDTQAAPAAAALPMPTFEGQTELKLHGEFSPLPDDTDDTDASFLRTLVLPDLKVPVTRRTIRYVRLFTKTESGRQNFLARFRRAGAYREVVERALRDAGLPEDLEWVAAIESGYDPRVVSPKGAAGLWQFMPETGSTYGLYQSAYVDERMDVIRSSRAAVSHMRDLYERFGRWDMALAAYNMGYDGVLRATEKYLASPGSKERRPSAPVELSELAEAKLIPEETANYVPQIMAFAIVAANRSRFGLDVTSLAPAEPLDLAEISVPEGSRLRTIARAAGMSTSTLRDYNPHLLRDRVPPTGGDFIVYIPSTRVQRTLVSFPAFQDHEVLVDEEGTEPSDAVPDPLAGPMPSRPKNRLPPFVVPGGDQTELIGPPMAFAAFNHKLPVVTVGGDLGWRRPSPNDALSLLVGGTSPRKGREVVLDVAAAQLGPKMLEPLAPGEKFTLPSGVTVEVVSEPSAAMVAITTRIAPEISADVLAKGVAPTEVRSTLTVPARSLETGIDVMVRRLRLALGESEGGSALRRAASAPYKHDLALTPGGQAWLALGDALFPKGHALEGTVITGRADVALYCDLFLAEQMRRERAPRRVTVTVAGNVTRGRVEKAFETAVLAAEISEPEIASPSREERVSVESAARRLLYGWIGPAEGQPGHAAMRVAIEILAGGKGGRLRKALMEDEKVASEMSAVVEPNPRAATFAIDVALIGDASAPSVDEALDDQVESLGNDGPTANEVALARALIGARIERARKSVQQEPNKKSVPLGPATLPIASRVLLDPAAYERLLTQLGEVTPNSVKLAAKRLLAKEHRVVVVSGPNKKAPVSN